MNETTKKILYAVVTVLLLGGAFAAGRYTLPAKVVTVEKQVEVEKVVTQVQIQYVEKKVYVQAEARNVRTVTTTTKEPDGAETTTTTTVDLTKVDTASTQESSSQATETQVVEKVVEVEKMKTVENEKDWHLSVSLGAGARFIGEVTPQLGLGAQVERRIIGPFFMGLRIDALAGLKPTAAVVVGPPITVTGSLVFGLGF